MAPDTSPAIEAMQVARWRSMSPAEKLAEVTQLTESAMALAEIGVRRRHPDADEAEVRRRVIALRVGRDLSVAAYGWDPDVEGW